MALIAFPVVIAFACVRTQTMRTPATLPALTFILGILSVDLNFDFYATLDGDARPCGGSLEASVATLGQWRRVLLGSGSGEDETGSYTPEQSPVSFVVQYYYRMTHRPLVLEFLVILVVMYLLVVLVHGLATTRGVERSLHGMSLLLLVGCKLLIDLVIKKEEKKLAYANASADTQIDSIHRILRLHLLLVLAIMICGGLQGAVVIVAGRKGRHATKKQV